jgi:hypothetical protein
MIHMIQELFGQTLRRGRNKNGGRAVPVMSPGEQNVANKRSSIASARAACETSAPSTNMNIKKARIALPLELS